MFFFSKPDISGRAGFELQPTGEGSKPASHQLKIFGECCSFCKLLGFKCYQFVSTTHYFEAIVNDFAFVLGMTAFSHIWLKLQGEKARAGGLATPHFNP